MLGEATLHVSRTFAGERNTASHSVCRPAKALPWGLWHPILMQFYSGPLMHLLSGVDTSGLDGVRCGAQVINGHSRSSRLVNPRNRPDIVETRWGRQRDII